MTDLTDGAMTLEEASKAMASSNDADEVLSIVESMMDSESAVIQDEGTIVAEIKTVSVSPTGAPPKFDSASWMENIGLSLEGSTNLNSQLLNHALGKKYVLPSKKNVMSDGKV